MCFERMPPAVQRPVGPGFATCFERMPLERYKRASKTVGLRLATTRIRPRGSDGVAIRRQSGASEYPRGTPRRGRDPPPPCRYAKAHFPKTPTLDFALEVEAITTAKRSNLILNVDGCVAVCFVDLLRHCGAMTVEEADELIANGCLNGLFVLGRSIGFIGHHLDQKRLKQPLYRHPWDDISYIQGDV